MRELFINKEFLSSTDFDYTEKKSQYKNKTENKFLVLHNIAISNIKKIIEIFKKFRVSCHYIIDQNGEIFQLVNENKIAHHCGVSHWKNEKNLNQNSIGIEFINTDPFSQKFPKIQLDVGAKLCKDIIKRNDIKPQNIVGHSDIAYFPNKKPYADFGIEGFLNRKQDPSHLFDWEYFAKNGVGFWYDKSQIDFDNFDVEFYLGQKNTKIKIIKQKLKNIGYKTDLTDYFDLRFKNLLIVFCRRFIPNKIAFAEEGQWLKIFSEILDSLLKKYK
jgi:N-acetyl-anhydromuramyl-L-alanine amidase AmpD